MATDLSKAKKLTGSVFPEGAIDAEGAFARVEPLISPKLLKSRFMGGLPMSYPITGEKIGVTDLKDAIQRAINIAETETGLNFQPVLRRLRLPFDPNLYHKNMWFEVPYKPIQKIHRIAICSASYKDTDEASKQYPSGAEIYSVPLDWVDTSYAAHGKIHVNPINPAFTAVGTATAAGSSGATILTFIGQQFFVPAFWNIEVVTGFCTENGNVPVFINEVVGARAAMLILDNLIPAYRIASQSMGIDGLSQSVNDLGYQMLTTKRDKLEAQYKEYVKLLKVRTGSTFFASNV